MKGQLSGGRLSGGLGSINGLIGVAGTRRQAALAQLQQSIRALECESMWLNDEPEIADLRQSLIAARDALLEPVPRREQRRLDAEADRVSSLHTLLDRQADNRRRWAAKQALQGQREELQPELAGVEA